MSRDPTNIILAHAETILSDLAGMILDAALVADPDDPRDTEISAISREVSKLRQRVWLVRTELKTKPDNTGE